MGNYNYEFGDNEGEKKELNDYIDLHHEEVILVGEKTKTQPTNSKYFFTKLLQRKIKKITYKGELTSHEYLKRGNLIYYDYFFNFISKTTSTTEITISSITFDDGSFSHLCQALSKNNTIEKLYFHRCIFIDNFEILKELSDHLTLKEINFDFGSFENHETKLCHVFKIKGLKSFAFRSSLIRNNSEKKMDTKIFDGFFEELGKKTSFDSLTFYHPEGNHLLLEYLRNHKIIKKLSCSVEENDHSSEVLKIFFNENRKIEELFLLFESDFEFESDSLRKFSCTSILPNLLDGILSKNSLEYLIIRSCDSDNFEMICKNKTLKSLNIGYAGKYDILLKNLQQNTSIENLSINVSNISNKDILDNLIKLIQKKKKLISLSLNRFEKEVSKDIFKKLFDSINLSNIQELSVQGFHEPYDILIKQLFDSLSGNKYLKKIRLASRVFDNDSERVEKKKNDVFSVFHKISQFGKTDKLEIQIW
eukprot:gene6070-10078_t